MYGCETLYTKQGRLLPCFYFESLTSSNDEAKRLVKEEGHEPRFAVAAAGQTAGRGRRSRPFFSPRDKGLYLSFVTPAGKRDPVALGALSALAVHALAEEYFGIDARFKWPNDVLADGKKLCGILPESTVGADGKRYIVIGLGINVFETEEDFGELADIATSASLCCRNEELKSFFMRDGRAFLKDAAVRLTELCSALADAYEGGEDLISEYSEKLVTTGRRVRFSGADGKPRTGRAVGVDERCALLVDCPDGRVAVGWGEVTELTGDDE